MLGYVIFFIFLINYNLQIAPPRDDFVPVAGNFESLATFLHSNNSNVCQSYLICRSEYHRHCELFRFNVLKITIK